MRTRDVIIAVLAITAGIFFISVFMTCFNMFGVAVYQAVNRTAQVDATGVFLGNIWMVGLAGVCYTICSKNLQAPRLERAFLVFYSLAITALEFMLFSLI